MRLTPEYRRSSSIFSRNKSSEQGPFFNKEPKGSFFAKEENESTINPFISRGKKAVQAKLKMGEPGDKYEREADQMAEKVVNKTNGSDAVQKMEGEKEEEIQQKPLAASVTPFIQKESMPEEEKVQTKCADCEKEEAVQKVAEEKEEKKELQAKEEEKEEEPVQKMEEKKEEENPIQKMGMKEEEPLQQKEEKKEEKLLSVQAKAKPGRGVKNTSIESALSNSKGGGTPLKGKVRTEMEQGFGADFGGVRIHTGSKAQEMSKQIGAQAFTHGNDIYFNHGKFNPGSKSGKELLAHELTHTIQQKGARRLKIQKQGGDNPTMTASRFKRNAKLEAALQDKGNISVGAEGEHVTILQKALIDAGFSLPKYGMDGKFGSETKAAVKAYQSKYNLKVDGIVGPETMGHMDKNFGSVVETDRYLKWYEEQIKLYKKESDFPFHVAIMNVFYKTRNFHVIQMLNDIQYEVWTFTKATDVWKYKDGRIETTDLTNRLRGNTDRANKIIRLNPKLSPLKAAMTLYHEMNHVVSKEPDYLKQEIESRVVTEQFAIDNNLPPTKAEYRTKDGKVDVKYIENEIRNSSHYNPTDKTRIKRSYDGMKKIGPWVVPK